MSPVARVLPLELHVLAQQPVIAEQASSTAVWKLIWAEDTSAGLAQCRAGRRALNRDVPTTAGQ